MNLYKQHLGNRIANILYDERKVSWKYLLPINDTSHVLVVCNTIENISIGLARSVKHVTVMGLHLEQASFLKHWAEKENIKNLSIVEASCNRLPFKREQFDIIIVYISFSLINGNADFFSVCSHILKPKGFIFYVGKSKFIKRNENSLSVRKCVKLLKQRGWTIQQIYAFLPDCNKYKIVLPTKPLSVFLSGLRMHNTLMPSSKLIKIGLAVIRTIGLLEWIIPGYGLLITKNGGELKSWFQEYLCKKVNKDNIYTIIHNASSGKGAKAILKVVEQNGESLAYVKVADNPHRGQFIESESSNLFFLKDIHFEKASIPKVISFEKINGHYILALETSKEKFKRNIRTMNEEVLAFLIELFVSTSSHKLLHETLFWKEISSNLEKFERSPFIKNYTWLKAMVQDISMLMKGEYFPFGLVHRDFVGWNLKRMADGKLYVMDWEWSKTDFIPFQDFFHFVLLTEWANSKKNVCSIMKKSFFTKHGKYKSLLQKYSLSIGVPIEWSYYFLILYLIEWMIFHLLNSTEIGQWAQETLIFLSKIRRKETYTVDKWLKG